MKLTKVRMAQKAIALVVARVASAVAATVVIVSVKRVWKIRKMAAKVALKTKVPSRAPLSLQQLSLQQLLMPLQQLSM